MPQAFPEKPATPGPGAGSRGRKRVPALVLAVLIGFAGVIFIPFFVHWYEVGIFGSDWPPVTTINALAPIALFMVLLLVAGFNPLLRWLAPSISFGRRELLIVVSLWLVASAVCFRDLGMRVLSAAGNTFGPGVHDKAIVKNNVRDYLNKDLYLPDSEEVPAATEYFQGRSYDNKTRVEPLPRSPRFRRGDFSDLVGLARKLRQPTDPLSRFLAGRLSPGTAEGLDGVIAAAGTLPPPLLEALNAVRAGESIYASGRFSQLKLPDRTGELKASIEELKEVAKGREDLRGRICGQLAQPDTLADFLKEMRRLDRLSNRLSEADLDSESRATVAADRDRARAAVEGRLRDANAAEEVIRAARQLADLEERRQELRAEVRKIVRESPQLERLYDPFGEKSELLRLNRRLLEIAYPRMLAPVGRDALRAWTFREEDLKDLPGLARALTEGRDPVSRHLAGAFKTSTGGALQRLLEAPSGTPDPLVVSEAARALVADLNRVMEAPLYDETRFAEVPLDEAVKELIAQRAVTDRPAAEDLARLAGLTERLNRLLLEMAYPADLAKSDIGRAAPFTPDDLLNPSRLVRRLAESSDPTSHFLRRRLSEASLGQFRAFSEQALACEQALIADLNAVMDGGLIYDEDRFSGATLTTGTRKLLDRWRSERLRLNRRLLEEAWPEAIAVLPEEPERSARLVPDDLKDPAALGDWLAKRDDALAAYLAGRVKAATLAKLQALGRRASGSPAAIAKAASALAVDLNAVIETELIYDRERFAGVSVSRRTRGLLAELAERERGLNRRLIQEGYPGEVVRLPTSVPWGAWAKPLLFWGALMVVFVVFSISLVRTTHRQWSQHELLTYPIAGVADALVGIRRGRLLPDALHDRLFWVGFGAVAVLLTINGLGQWYPRMIQIPIYWSHTDIVKEFTFLSKYCGREAYAFFRGWFYPFVIALAALLPTEISLTCWLGWALMVIGTGSYFFLTAEVITAHETGHIQNGMQVAMVVAILVIGRREYLNVLRCAFFLGRPGKDEGLRRARNACWVFLASFVGMVALLCIANLDWFLAVVVTMSFGLVVLLIARMTAEVGHPWLVNFVGLGAWLPLKMLGAAALGPQGLAVIASVGGALAFNTSNTVAAQQTTIAKLRENTGGWFVRSGFNLILATGILLALASTTFFTLWENHSFGAKKEQASVRNVKGELQTAANHINRLKNEVGLEKVEEGSGLGRLHHAKSEKKYWRFFLMGAALVGLCAFMRLRFAWWPFHPLPLMFFNTWAMSRMAFPIMLGWLIKLVILKIWGGKVFARSKPFFYGAILGQIAVTGVWVVVGAVYFLVCDVQPKIRFNYFYH